MMLTSKPQVKFEVIHETLQQKENLVNVETLCEIAGVTRAGYYKWLKAEPKREARERADEADFNLILKAYKFRGYDKGALGIHMRLLRETPPVIMNPKKVRRLMRKYNLFCPIRKPNPYRQIKRALQSEKVAPNILNREFRTHGARTVLLTDITYIPRAEGKFSYLCVIMDAYTKEVWSWTVSWSLALDFVLETVEKMLEKHGSELNTDVVLHSDQGFHYTSHKFVDLLSDSELRQSMSRKGNCWDNAPQESFFGHMKDEIQITPFDRNYDIKLKVDDWMDYYNHDRYQWGLAKLSPCEYYGYATTGKYPLPIVSPDLVFTQSAPL
jgi:transposase InsO family protein